MQKIDLKTAIALGLSGEWDENDPEGSDKAIAEEMERRSYEQLYNQIHNNFEAAIRIMKEMALEGKNLEILTALSELEKSFYQENNDIVESYLGKILSQVSKADNNGRAIIPSADYNKALKIMAEDMMNMNGVEPKIAFAVATTFINKGLIPSMEQVFVGKHKEIDFSAISPFKPA